MSIPTTISAEWITVEHEADPRIWTLIIFDDYSGDEYRVLLADCQIDSLLERISSQREEEEV